MEWNRIKVEIGTVDFTAWLANVEQMALLPDNAEVGRGTFTMLDSGTMPAITEWQPLTLYAGGTAATIPVWAGYVTRITQEPFNSMGGSAQMVTLDCQSAAIRLLTTEPITTQYGGGDNESITLDRDVVSNLVETYAPDLYNADKIGTASQVQIDYIAFANDSLRSAMNKLSQRTGRTFGVDAAREFWYRDTSQLGEYVYGLAEVPDDNTQHEMTVKPYFDRDALDLRNKVRVVGGWTLSDIQEETFAGDDATVLFTLAVRPDVIVSVVYGGVAQTVGLMYVDDPADFDCLVNYDRQYILFDTAPESGKDVVVRYRYKTRVDVTVENATSIAAIGTLWAPTLEDASISSVTQGSALGSAYLASIGMVQRAQVATRFSGPDDGTVLPWQPHYEVPVWVTAFGWSEELLTINRVTMRALPRPDGDGACVVEWDLDLGTRVSVGQTLGNDWNNTEVLPRQYTPDVTEAMAEASAGVTDHGALSGLADDDHTQYLLATGARTGASSQAQTFTNGIIGPTWKPASDSTTALQLQNAAGTAVLTVDTTNRNVGIGASPSASAKLYAFASLTGAGNIQAMNFLTYKYDSTGTTYIYGATGNVQNLANSANSAVTVMQGLTAGCNTSAASGLTATTSYAMALAANSPVVDGAGTKTVTNNYGLYIYNQGATGVTNAHGIYVAAISGAATNNKALVTDGGAVIFNETGTDSDLRIEGDTDADLVFVDAGNDRVGFGTSSPATKLHGLLTSASTNAVTNVLTLGHTSSGTVDNGFGAGQLFELKSSTAVRSAARIQTLWNEKTDATRKADLVLTAYDSGGEREGLRIRGTGSAAAIGFLGATPAARQPHVADPSGGATVDAEARTAINAILVTLETFGHHATS